MAILGYWKQILRPETPVMSKGKWHKIYIQFLGPKVWAKNGRTIRIVWLLLVAA